jgi:two-component system cell cycle sensor histidine kinase/response regulator CckA
MPSVVGKYLFSSILIVSVGAISFLILRNEPIQPMMLTFLLVPLIAVLYRFFTTQATTPSEVEADPVTSSQEEIEHLARMNETLKRELMESRLIDEARELQGRAFDAFVQGVTITDPNRPGNPIIYVNDGFTRLTGFSRDEVIGKSHQFLYGPETSPDALTRIRLALNAGQPCMVEVQNYRKDRTPFWNNFCIAPIIEEGVITHFVFVQTDISSFKQMEHQFRQAQKMEAIGHLAGGVAHDFNNLLTIINGCSELIRAGAPLPTQSSLLLDEIHKAGERAATLTRQLLAFSRKTVLQPRLIDLGCLIKDFQKMIGRLIEEDIRLTTHLAPDARKVRVDPGQMEQVLMNLVLNARDAMPQGGELRVELQNATLTEPDLARFPDLTPGKYVLLTVSDTGCGMDTSTINRLFEPFFTTKPVGKGTGLGLAMVYGIVKASGGHISVQSESGKGTTFQIHLPIHEEIAPIAPVPMSVSHPGGHETILVVEDEDGVRRLTHHALKSRGYVVLEARSGEQALELLERHPGPINLLLTDVVMPGMNGRELAERVRKKLPGTRIIFCSGYTDDAIVRNGISEEECDFLQKPFGISNLLLKVRDVLDRSESYIDEPMAALA